MNGTRSNLTAAGWLVAVAFALIGQFYLSTVQGNVADNMRDGFTFYGIAVALFIGLITYYERENLLNLRQWDWSWVQRLRDQASEHSIPIALVIAAFATAYTTLRFIQTKSGAVSYWDAFAIWALGGVLYIAAFIQPRHVAMLTPRRWLPAVRPWAAAHRFELLTLLAILVVTVFVRFFWLGFIPDIVSGDEGRIGSLGLEATVRRNIVSPFVTSFGHSSMYLFMEGAMLAVFGVKSAFGLRVLHAIAGTLNVLALYLLGREMFDRRVGLVAAALLAVSHFHIHFSRIIVAGSIVDALMTTIAIYLFWRGLKRGSTLAFALSGITVGLHLYFYMGARLVIMFMLAYVVALYLTNYKFARGHTGHFLVFLGGFASLALPMGWWAYSQPQEFMARVNQVGIYQSGWVRDELGRRGFEAGSLAGQFEILFEQFRKSMLVFNVYPATGFYNARLPMLDYFSAVPFVLGLMYALWKMFEPRYLLLHAWFWSAVVAGNVLLVNPDAAAYRVLILGPCVFLLAGVAMVKLIDLAQRSLATSPRMVLAVVGLFFALTSYVNLQYYFGEYAPSCRYEDSSTRLASKMAGYLAQFDPQTHTAYLLGGPRLTYGIHPNWDFLTDRMPIMNIAEPILSQPTFVDPARGAIFLFIPERYGEVAAIQNYYPVPGAPVIEFYDCLPEPVGKAWYVPAPGTALAPPADK